ncbi:DNA glycosylase AlkZ-like family protein [Streptomyces xantholiticus]|uniref:DNA glycosylase AlkZ-like family protein n=1 Tax=Streptomyces xantholiticus TaxID=68285 RepID=UPI003D9F1FFA
MVVRGPRGVRRCEHPSGADGPRRRRGGPASPDPPLPGRLRTRVRGGHGTVHDGPAAAGQDGGAGARRRARAVAGPRRHGDVRHPRCPPVPPGAPRPPKDTPAPPRLLPMWDSILLAYADRSRVIPPAYRKHVTRVNGDVLPTLLVDGRVAGVWRAVDGAIEATAFHPLPREAWKDLAAEAESLVAFLAPRAPRAYGRYDHWWTKPLPAAETRLLPGS